jgi:hypothetical protein
MAYNFLRRDRDQLFLLSPDLRDWLPEGHLAWFVLGVLDQLDLAPFYRAHRDDGHGHPAYHPKTCSAYCCTPTASACAPPGRAELTSRIMCRGKGGSWSQPGDPLRGQPTAYLSQVAQQATADAQALDRAHLDAVRIDTDGRTAAEATDLIAAATRWPG